VSGQDQKKPQQGMPSDSGSQKQAQPKTDSDRDMQSGKSGTDTARSDQNQKR
jgi:hypothetical protein